MDKLISPLNGDDEDFVIEYGPDLIDEAITEARATPAQITAEPPATTP